MNIVGSSPAGVIGERGEAISVSISTCSRARYLGECILSMLSQTMSPLEIIVVDDGSTDEAMDVVRGSGDSKIRYVGHKNMGKSVALNHALSTFMVAGGAKRALRMGRAR